ncbi:MAG: hypothetical protein ABIH83_01545 [Candidatus Micrarchaeota archaeon]
MAEMGLSLNVLPPQSAQYIKPYLFNKPQNTLQKIALIGPHTCEREAVFPVQKELEKRLEYENICTELYSINDKMQKCGRIRNYVKDSSEHNDFIDNILNFEDFFVRTNILRNFFTKYSINSVALEVHAMRSDIWESDEEVSNIGDASNWSRLKNTRILVQDSVLRGFLDYYNIKKPINEHCKKFENFTVRISRILELGGIYSAMKKFEENIEFLQQFDDRIKLIKIPANLKNLGKYHQYFSLYYDTNHNNHWQHSYITSFESKYASSYLTPLNIRLIDINAVLEFIKAKTFSSFPTFYYNITNY